MSGRVLLRRAVSSCLAQSGPEDATVTTRGDESQYQSRIFAQGARMLGITVSTRPLSEKELREVLPSGVTLHEFAQGAAEHPCKSRVHAIGVYSSELDRFKAISDRMEAVMLEELWSVIQSAFIHNVTIVGAHLTAFALPFAVWRSWALELPIPPSLVDVTREPPRWNPLCRDVHRAFAMGTHIPANYDDIAGVLGTGGHEVDYTPGTVAAMWKRNRQAALKRLRVETMQPVEWARRMGMK